MNNRRGQQEMVGFILIVVLVVVGLMVFLLISMRDSPVEADSLVVENMLGAIMKHTTECAIVFEPQFDDFEDLFKSAYRGKECSNLNRSAKDYLNESFRAVLGDLVLSEATVEAWKVDFFVRDGEGVLQWFEGNCSGNILAAQRSIVSSSETLVVQMTVCR